MQGRCDNSGRQLAQHVHHNACTIVFQEDLLAVQNPAPPLDNGRLLLSQLHLLQDPLDPLAHGERADAVVANGSALFLTDVVLESAPSSAVNAVRALDLQRLCSLAMHGALPALWGCGKATPFKFVPVLHMHSMHVLYLPRTAQSAHWSQQGRAGRWVPPARTCMQGRRPKQGRVHGGCAAAGTRGEGAGGAIRGFRENTMGAAVHLGASAAASFIGVAFENISLTLPASPDTNGPVATLRKDAFANFTNCNFTNITDVRSHPPTLRPSAPPPTCQPGLAPPTVSAHAHACLPGQPLHIGFVLCTARPGVLASAAAGADHSLGCAGAVVHGAPVGGGGGRRGAREGVRRRHLLTGDERPAAARRCPPLRGRPLATPHAAGAAPCHCAPPLGPTSHASSASCRCSLLRSRGCGPRLAPPGSATHPPGSLCHACGSLPPPRAFCRQLCVAS